MTDLLGGQFDMMCDQTTTTTNLIKESKIKGYAGDHAHAPCCPFRTFRRSSEFGLKDFEVTAWHAMWAPKGLPSDVAAKLNAALQAALKDSRVIERLATLGSRACGHGACNTRRSEGASDGRGRQMGPGDQGRGRTGRVSSSRLIAARDFLGAFDESRRTDPWR